MSQWRDNDALFEAFVECEPEFPGERLVESANSLMSLNVLASSSSLLTG